MTMEAENVKTLCECVVICERGAGGLVGLVVLTRVWALDVFTLGVERTEIKE